MTENNLVDHLFRTESGKMTAILTRIFGFRHSNLVDDIIQETFLSALKTWPLKGQPDNPSAWLMQVAKNKANNTIKRKSKLAELDIKDLQDTDQISHLFLDHEIRDSQLRLLFACCYPELPEKTQILFMLKTLCGFSNTEIASALIMSPEAVKKSVYRAKKDIQANYDSISLPAVYSVWKKVDTVYTVIYLMFTEGYKRSTEVSIINEDLCFEAARLAKLLLDIPDLNHGKTHALLSLIYFGMSRFPARKSNLGQIIDLEQQDRSLWDKKYLNAGIHHLRQSRQSKTMSKYHLESTIASLHCSAKSFEQTDWKAIVSLYRKLLEWEDTAIVQMNYAIALARVEGAETALRALNEIDLQSLRDKQYLFYAAKADMHKELQMYEKAKSYYQVALDLALPKEDKDFLQSKMEACDRKNISKN